METDPFPAIIDRYWIFCYNDHDNHVYFKTFFCKCILESNDKVHLNFNYTINHIFNTSDSN